jgi:putative ABC transport system permease protein
VAGRSMFWRILRQLMRAGRGRLILALIAVTSGAAVCSALIGLDLDAQRKLTHEFRAFGANVVVSPPGSSDQATLDGADVMSKIDAARTPAVAAAAPFLYVVGVVGRTPGSPVIVAGTWLDEVARMDSWWTLEGQWIASRDDTARCLVGRAAARQLGLAPGSQVDVHSGARTVSLTVAAVVNAGGTEDNQIFVNLRVAQDLAGLPGRIGLVELDVTGSPEQLDSFTTSLAAALPGLEVRPVRQLTEAEGQLLGRIHGLLFWTVALILALTALCVLAAMAALAVERRRDVGLMKAIGGPVSRVVRLFLAEAGTLGLAGGVLGYVLGLGLAEWVGESVFGMSVTPRWEVLPATVILSVGVALAGALPLRLLGRVRPAEILRGE